MEKNKKLIKNVTVINAEALGFAAGELLCVGIDGAVISFVEKYDADSDAKYKNEREIVDGKGMLLIPAFFNTHCHAPMTLLRGFGEDLPLHRWLDERILPAEDKLDGESVYFGTVLAIAEMLSGGIASFSDMYMFEDNVARAALDCGIKANVSRSIVSFDENGDPSRDYRIDEAKNLIADFHGAGEGRILVDMALHAEYTNVEKYCSYLAGFAADRGLRMQLHLSETTREHEKCIAKRGKTPLEFFRDCNVLEVPTTAAHCVWVSQSDIGLLAEKRVSVSHNPTSNLKLASGVMPIRAMLDAGVAVSLGTDGAASNNNLDIMKELQLASLLSKGSGRETPDAAAIPAETMFPLATRAGALAQGREDCGEIKVGYRADLALIDDKAINNIPSYNAYYTLLHSAKSSNVRLTMVDGRILYRDGEYTTIDTEKVGFMISKIITRFGT